VPEKSDLPRLGRTHHSSDWGPRKRWLHHALLRCHVSRRDILFSSLRFPLSQDVHVVPKPLTLCGYSSHITAPRPWKSTRPGFLLLRGPGTPATTAMAFSNYQRQCSTTVQFLCLRNGTWVISSAIDKSLTSPTGNRDMVSAPQSLRQV